jgi:hypothetical protein
MTKPRSLNPLAEEILIRLSAHPEASEIVLGGYFALQHYADYRQTHDIDAWWKTHASRATEDAIRTVMAGVAEAEGLTLRERSFGDTVSFELHRERVKEFSFQIALRSIALDEPVASAWPPILIETLHDNVGSKMNALVNRGAPRDLVDIKHVVDEGLVSVEDAWAFWAKKNPGQTIESAKQKVLLYLEVLEAKRPLDSISDAGERARAKELRDWYRVMFLQGE